MRLVTTFIQNTESTDPDLSYLNRARFVLSVADGHGSDGVGILDAVIRNRHLFLSMTSGAEIDAGSVFTEDDLPVASDSRLGIAAFDPAYFSILAGKVSLRGDLDFGLNETQLAEYLTANKYATQAWVAAQGFIGSDGLALYATKEWVLGQNFAKASSLGNYLLKSVWDEVFEVTTVNGVRVLNVKLDIAGLKGISAYGLGSTSGGSASGSLGELVNVGQWADEVPTADRVMVQLAGTTHWSAKPLADLVGLDTAALAQYLTANSYLKASDISSYLTWANLSGKPTVYPTSWELVADKPTVYPTAWTSVTGRPTKLSQFTDDVVAGNYLPKPTWDAVFEVVTVDGTPVLKVKYDILGLKGITAYADGSLSGGFSGALVDLVDVAVTNLASGDILKYNGTHFVNVPVSSIAGASSWDQITGKPEYYPTRWADVSGAPTSLPASDVYPWAKAVSKPTYTAAEVGALALSGGTLTGNVITIGSFILANSGAYPQLTFRATADNSERLLFRHGNDLKWRYNGTNDGIIYHSGNFNPGNYLLLSGGTMTGDITFGSNGRSLRGSDGGNIAGVLYDTPNARYVTAIGTGSRRLILVSPASIYRGAGGVAENYMIYDSGNFNPSSKLDKSVWDEAFELKTVNGVRVLNVKLDIAGLKGISAYGLGSTSGGSASGSLGELVNVGQWADEVPTADRVMVQLAGTTHWSAKPLADLVGLDTAALAQYLTANSYLKASDISSYLTWANLSGKPTVYPTSWELVADKPTVYPTAWTSVTGRPTKLSQFTDDVVAGNYLPKPTWDAVFEVVTVDGTPVLKVKYDILGLKGITAYADGSLSGGFSGALVDLVDVAVTNLASGDILKYNGTHFVNVPVSSIAGASSWDQITGKPEYYPTRWADVSGAPTSLPASDVYPWAKAVSKPTYTAAEVGALALSGGTLTGNVITIGSFILANSGAYPQLTFRATADNSERLLFRHGNDLKWRYNGTNDGIIYHSGNFNPGNYLLLSGGTMTGDITFGSNGRSLRGSDGGNIAGVLYDTPNARYVTAIGTGSRRLILVSPASIYRGAGGVAENYMIYDSGNFNPSSKLDKSVWDEAFELKTVNGVRVISAKLDFLSVAGISAYATGPSSGGGGGGLDYDLLKQALTGAIIPDGYPFTISASFLGAIDKTYLTGKLANTYADKVHTHLWANITDRPTALPANGGNADTVDNLHASSFAQIKSYTYPDGGINNITDLDFTGNIQAHFPGHEYSCIWQGKDFRGVIFQLKLKDYYTQSMMYRGGETKTWRTVWDSGNFNPENYLPLSGGSITGGLGVSGYLTAGVLRVKATSYPQISFVNTTTNRDSLLFVNGSELYWRPTAGTATDYQVYHSGNFNPDSKLGVSSVAVEAKKMSYQGLMTAISGTTTFPAGLYLYGVYSNGYPVTYGNLLRVGGSGLGEMLFGWAGDASVGGLYYRSKRDVAATAWSSWCKLWTSANSNLSTIDWSANNLNAAANLDVAGQAYVSGWLRSRGNVGWYSQDYGGGIHMTDSTWVRVYGSKGLMIDTGTSPFNMGQLQITCSAEASIGFRSASNGNWCLGKGVSSIGSGFGLYNAATNRVAFQIASATDNASFVGSITAPTFVGNLSGSASSVNGYDINSFTGYYKYTIDASSLDQNTYYPVTMYLGNHHTVRISVLVALDSGTKPAWSSHASGYSVRFIEEVNGSGWGTSEVSRSILANEYRFANANPVGRVEQMTNSSTEVIWVRGGGKYFFYLSIPYITPALRTSTFTTASQSVSPRTDTMDLRTAALGSGIAINKLYAHNSIEINGFTIDVYNGALRVNGNLVATGGVTAYQ